MPARRSASIARVRGARTEPLERLAGEEPVPVAGVTFFPVGPDGTVSSQLKDFEIELSLDGQTWTPALTGQLTTQGVEQAFTLEEPVGAQYARLRVLSGQAAEATVVSDNAPEAVESRQTNVSEPQGSGGEGAPLLERGGEPR
ncbi:MAG: discoidin domain-containing protein [Thermomicrobiales bacterium]